MKSHRTSHLTFALLVFCALIVSSFAINASGQEIPKRQNGCAYLNKEKPSLFLSYERELTERNNTGQLAKRVLLRLHNNSDCSINVELAI